MLEIHAVQIVDCTLSGEALGFVGSSSAVLCRSLFRERLFVLGLFMHGPIRVILGFMYLEATQRRVQPVGVEDEEFVMILSLSLVLCNVLKKGPDLVGENVQ
jgi:hypothetical protein